MLPPAIMIESHFADARHPTVEETAHIHPPDDPHPMIKSKLYYLHKLPGFRNAIALSIEAMPKRALPLYSTARQ